MGITVSTSPQQVTASVSEDKVTATVSAPPVTATVQAGVGATGAAGAAGASGSSGVVSVSAPLTNSGTGSAAVLALSVGSGLGVSAGSLVVSSVPLASLAQGGATAGQVVRWNGTAWSVGNVTAGSTAWDDITGKPTFGTLATQDGTFSGTSSGTNTGDQTITLTGDVTGSGTGSFAATLSSTGVSAGTYTSVTVDAKGRVTAGSSPAVAYSSLSGVPSTFAPSAHKSSHATGGSDALTAADIGAAATSHSHAASDITSGTIDTARLASGTANSGTFLRGDQTWAAAGGSSSASDLTSGTVPEARLPQIIVHPFLLMGG